MTYKATIIWADSFIETGHFPSEADAWAWTTDACDCCTLSCIIEPDPDFIGPTKPYED